MTRRPLVDLSREQRITFALIRLSIDREGRAPTISELSCWMRMRPHGVREKLITLEHYGYIRRQHGKRRGIEIVE